jgi:hypothetical protein
MIEGGPLAIAMKQTGFMDNLLANYPSAWLFIKQARGNSWPARSFTQLRQSWHSVLFSATNII